MLKMVEENQLNRVATVNTLDRVKTLTAGTLYRSGQIVLNEDCLVHVKDRHNEKKRETMTVTSSPLSIMPSQNLSRLPARI